MQVLYGSVLHLLVHYILPGEPAANLRTVWTKVLQFYDSLQIKNRYYSMKLTMFSHRGGCKLKGTAAEIRSFGRVLHPIWKMYYNEDIGMHSKIKICLRLGNHMEKILDDHPDDFVLPGASRAFFNLS